MNRIDKLLSYIYPIIVESSSSKVNSLLEVVFRDGRYQLNSTNANYSYGGLYDLFQQIFKEVYIDWEKVNNVLILGFGTGCSVPLIQKYNPNCSIIGVEIDEKVIEFGYTYFKVDKYANTAIVCDDAFRFVNSSTQKFDLIIIDVYIDTKVPEEFETEGFLKNLKKILNKEGLVIFNKLICSKEMKHQVPKLKALYQEVFGEVNLYTMMQTGQIFIASNNK